MGNPFLDDTPELISLDMRDIMDESVVATIRTIETLGIEQYKSYCSSVIQGCTRSIHEPIEKNSLAVFKTPKPNKTKVKQAKTVAMLKDNVSLF